MNFIIVGAGALGTIIGANLIQAGHAVTMVARGARAQALRNDGLRVRGLVDLSLSCQVVEDTSELTSADVLIFAVKTQQMEVALASMSHVTATSVVSVANGVMKNEQLASVYGAEHVLGCMADTSGELHADGVAEFTRNVCLNIGPYQDPTSTQSAAVAAAIDNAGVVTRAVDDIAKVEWSKFVAWVPMFVVSVIARRPTGQYLSNPDFAEIVAKQVKEAGAVAAHQGITLSDEAPLPVASIIAQPLEAGIELVRGVGRTMTELAPTHRMSSLQDLEAGRRLEVDGTLGYLVRLAQAHAIPVPTFENNYKLVVGIDGLQALG